MTGSTLQGIHGGNMGEGHKFLCGDSVHQSIIERTEKRTREGWLTFSVLLFGFGLIIGAALTRWAS